MSRPSSCRHLIVMLFQIVITVCLVKNKCNRMLPWLGTRDGSRSAYRARCLFARSVDSVFHSAHGMSQVPERGSGSGAVAMMLPLSSQQRPRVVVFCQSSQEKLELPPTV